MPQNESAAFQRFRNRLEQEKQTLQILDVSLISAHRVAKSKDGPLASALGYEQNKYDQLHVPSREGKRLITQAKNANYRAALICSGSMIPDTNVGGNIATINEVSDDQKATFFFS